MTNNALPKAVPLYQQVVDLIEARIAAGDYQIGDRLPTESELAADYRVSRTVIREALKTLRQKGIIESHPGRGTFLVGDVAKSISSSIDYMMRIEPEVGTFQLLELRMILEPEIARLAAMRASSEQVQRLEELVQCMDQAGSDPYKFSVADAEFHSVLASAAGNPVIQTIFSSVVDILRKQQFFRLALDSTGAQRSQADHIQILQAVRKGEPDRAKECMRLHLEQVRQDFQRWAPASGDSNR